VSLVVCWETTKRIWMEFSKPVEDISYLLWLDDGRIKSFTRILIEEAELVPKEFGTGAVLCEGRTALVRHDGKQVIYFVR